MAWDFNLRPELPNSMMGLYYFDSPHEQITRDFEAKVVKVHDGDTIRVKCDFRNFDFPIRLLGIDAPEIKTISGKESQRWLSDEIMGKDIIVEIDPNQRVGKWGRLLGNIIFQGMNINNLSKIVGQSVSFENRTLLRGSKKFKWD